MRDGDDAWRREQQGDFAKALGQAGHHDHDVRMIGGRTHGTVWSEMAKGDEPTSLGILQFVNRLGGGTR